MNGQLLARVNAMLRVARQIGCQLFPQRGGFVVIAAALGMLRQIAPGVRPILRRKPQIERLRASCLGAFAIAATLQES